jgi:hypothetical protein
VLDDEADEKHDNRTGPLSGLIRVRPSDLNLPVYTVLKLLQYNHHASKTLLKKLALGRTTYSTTLTTFFFFKNLSLSLFSEDEERSLQRDQYLILT